MIPYLPTPGFDVGDTRIDAWLILVLLGIVVGVEVCRKRAIGRGLSVKVAVDGAILLIAAGFVMAHVIHMVAYNFPTLREDPQLILPWYGGYSSFGGFLGAALAIPIYVRLRKVPGWAYMDNWAFAFLSAWVFGRAGCFMAHDHKGRLTDFFLAVDFPGGARHDLGLYEALFTLSLLIAFVTLDRNKARFHGFYTGLILVAYAPVRFAFDYLRATDLERINAQLRSDVRFAGLTPAQYGAIGLLGLGLWILIVRKNKGQQDVRGEAERDLGGRGKR